ncbi:hypothetical protein [Actinoplanes philippinensis]|uniref:hypothetical protein n=1 Tax=Actinoplanes philippinensis TaxID=35752 RepID=UPI0033F0D6D2
MKITAGLLTVGAVTATAIIGSAAAFIGAVPAGAVESADPLGSLVETYEYPDGDKVAGIRLIKGDGQILLVGCGEGRTSVEVYTYLATTPYCFEFKGKAGYVALELDEVYGIRNYNDFPIDAKIKVDDVVKPPVEVPADDWKGVGIVNGEGQALLLEIRA